MADFTIDGTAYQSGLMNGEMHALVLKRLLPTLTAVAGVIEKLPQMAAALKGASATLLVTSDEEEGVETPNARMARVMMPIAREIAAVKDDDLKFVLDACLDVTSRQHSVGVGWSRVRQKGGVIQDRADDAFLRRMTIAWHVLSENFGSVVGSMGVDVEGLKRAAGSEAALG